MSTIPSPLSAVPQKWALPVRILNLGALLSIFVVNALANLLPINDITTGEVSDKLTTLITPAGYAFTIWGLIYFALAFWGIYQLVPRTFKSRPINEGIGFMFLFNAACNVGWIFAWHYELTWLTIILMAGILITLSVIYARLSKFNPANSWIEYFGIHFGFSLYLAWILAASILNVFAVATNTEATFNGAAIAGLIIAGILEGSVSLFRLDPVIAFVGCWATAAIAVKQSDAIRTTAIVLAIILGGQGLMIGLWNILAIVKNRRRGWSSKDETLPVGSNETLPGAQKA